ncbi:hypothetical protein GCM10012319_39320 [Comamonas sp. KCTC 72670]|nr:hypothetical protein GCM10012319_39320 [Comamonas sp. KCTC 72670]
MADSGVAVWASTGAARNSEATATERSEVMSFMVVGLLRVTEAPETGLPGASCPEKPRAARKVKSAEANALPRLLPCPTP